MVPGAFCGWPAWNRFRRTIWANCLRGRSVSRRNRPAPTHSSSWTTWWVANSSRQLRHDRMVPVRRPRPTSGSLTARRSADARAPGHSDSEVAVEQLTHHCVRAVSPSGGLVVLHVPSGTYLKLDGSASTIVDLLIEHGDAEHATAALAARFAIPMERAGVDVAAVVTALTSLRASRASHARRPTASGALSVFRSWWRLSNPLKAAVVKAM